MINFTTSNQIPLMYKWQLFWLTIYENDLFEVTCGFAVGSRTMGCFLDLSSEFQNYSVFIPRDNGTARLQSHVMPLLEELNYCVYDWEEDGSIGNIPVPLQFSFVNISERRTTDTEPCKYPNSY